jgi:ubiquinone/menaquinone biosynthesis C-methylase UbiE
MFAHARSRHPDLGFTVGSMTDLDLADRSVGGVCAWYSTIHVPDPHLPKAFSEFHRILVPGGVALLGFQVGDEPRHLQQAFAMLIDLVFDRRSPDAVAHALSVAGLAVYAQTVREAEDDGIESTLPTYAATGPVSEVAR